MSSTSPSRALTRLTMAVLFSLALVVTGCSSDDGDDDAASTTTTEQGAGNGTSAGGGGDWCDAVRTGLNVTPGDQLSSLEAQREAAPDDLKDDYDALIDLVQHQQDNPSDAVGIGERTAAVADPMRNLIAAAQEECDITIDLGI